MRTLAFVLLVPLAACGPSYSPDTYATNAVQQAAKTERAVVIGVRPVRVSASGTTGAAAGAGAGGVLGAAVPATDINRALTAIGGGVVGGVVGSGIEHLAGDTRAFEYVLQEAKGDLVSVTQRDRTPLALGQHVLVISGPQARVVPDYTVALPNPAASVAVPGAPIPLEPASPVPMKADLPTSP